MAAWGQLSAQNATLCDWSDLLAAFHCSSGQETVGMLLCGLNVQWLHGASVTLKATATRQCARWAGCCCQPSCYRNRQEAIGELPCAERVPLQTHHSHSLSSCQRDNKIVGKASVLVAGRHSEAEFRVQCTGRQNSRLDAIACGGAASECLTGFPGWGQLRAGHARSLPGLLIRQHPRVCTASS